MTLRDLKERGIILSYTWICLHDWACGDFESDIDGPYENLSDELRDMPLQEFSWNRNDILYAIPIQGGFL